MSVHCCGVSLALMYLCITPWIGGLQGHSSGLTNVTDVVKEILANYDKNVAPFDISGKQLVVTVNIDVRSLSSISALSMDFVFSGFIRQRWTDERLAYSHLDGNTTVSDYIVLDTTSAHLVWKPDLYIPNAKSPNYNSFSFVRVFRNGTVHTSHSYSMTLSCFMNLHKFPMDNQTCPLFLESFAYAVPQMRFEWESPEAIAINYNGITIPEFYLTNHVTSYCRYRSITGSFPCLQLDLMLQRSIGFHLIQTFIPSILIVTVSWISFWINHQAVPARVSLSVTCVLTMVTQAASVRSDLPKVSYIKAMDVWMTSCLIFVFAALFEYAIVNVMARKEEPYFFEITDDNPTAGKNQDIVKGPNGKLFMKEVIPVHNRERKARAIESLARRTFPLGFIIFNLVYWTIYLVW